VTTLSFEDGTIRVDDPPAGLSLPFLESDPRSGTARAPAFRYSALRDVLDSRDDAYEDRVGTWSPLSLATTYDLREYQRDALDAWHRADRRGVVELPTGAGKTVVAIAAMVALELPTLVVVPTIDLLNQWRRELEAEFDVEVGQFGGGEQRQAAVTVSTYDSAYLRADDVGGDFGLVVFDEVHHLGGEGYRDIARLLAAPARLGLTATFERPDGRRGTRRPARLQARRRRPRGRTPRRLRHQAHRSRALRVGAPPIRRGTGDVRRLPSNFEPRHAVGR
jgi:hypothetical protein